MRRAFWVRLIAPVQLGWATAYVVGFAAVASHRASDAVVEGWIYLAPVGFVVLLAVAWAAHRVRRARGQGDPPAALVATVLTIALGCAALFLALAEAYAAHLTQNLDFRD